MNRNGMGRGLALYTAACLLAIGGAAALFVGLLYGTAPERRAIWTSAAVALLVQVGAFAIARRFAARDNGIAGWTLGAVICLTALVIYGFVSRALGLPSNAALLSLATFFFLTELIEPPLLNA
jgi:cobalamin synthase